MYSKVYCVAAKSTPTSPSQLLLAEYMEHYGRGSSTMSASSSKHIEVSEWLTALGLHEYAKLFKKYKGVEDMIQLSETDIKELGVKNSAHRARLVSSLVMLREKLYKKSPGASPSSSIAMKSPPQSSYSLQTAVYSNAEAELTHQHMLQQQQQILLEQQQRIQQQQNPIYQSPLYALNRGPSFHNTEPDPTEIRNHYWYHGNINRQKAERLVVQEGDYLVRDSTSQPGDYVMTCCHKNSKIHFVINKQYKLEGGVRMAMYQFEEQLFDSVPELIHFYVSNKKRVAEGSNATIANPILRNFPLDHTTSPVLGRRSPGPMTRVAKSQGNSPVGSPQLTRRLVHIPLDAPRRTGSQPLLSLEDDSEATLDRRGSLPDMLDAAPLAVYTQVQKPCNKCVEDFSPRRVGSDPNLSPKPSGKKPNVFKSNTGSDGELSKPPPPKPSRVPTIKKKERPVVNIRNKALYEDDGKDYSDYDQIKTWPSVAKKQSEPVEEPVQATPQGMKKSHSTRSYRMNQNEILSLANSSMDTDYDVPRTPQAAPDDNDLVPTKLPKAITMPSMTPGSDFHLGRFESDILPPENKPLDTSAMVTIKTVLLDGDSRLIASHSTLLDLVLLKVIGERDLGVNVTSGLELITLPQGKQLRQDTLERFNCMKLFVAVTVLTCSRAAERAQMIHCWIQVAHQLKGVLGNLFGFSTVMHGLMLRPITRLQNTWSALKQNFTNSAFSFEAKLVPFLRSLDTASSSLPLQDVTVPHIIPLLQLLERDQDHMSIPFSWEQANVDMDLDIMLTHLDTARVISEQTNLYRDTAEKVMKGFRPMREILEMFKTEMHLKLLWGARGAGVNGLDRYAKFDQLLEVLSERVEPSQRGDLESSL